MCKNLTDVVRILIALSIPAFIILMLFVGLDRQEAEAQKHCGHLSGYAYGECVMGYYR